MAASINRVLLVGNLTRDPELRHTQGGMAVCELRIAVNGREKVGDEWRDRADYFDVTVWGNQGESCAQYLGKGRPVAIDGKLRLEEWTDKDSGGKRSRVKIVADAVQFLGSGHGGEDSTGQQFVPAGAQPAGSASDDFGGGDDDIPF